MSVREYSLRFDSLARYAPSIVVIMRERIHRFIAGLVPELTEAYATAALQDSMDITWIKEFTQNIERGRRRQQDTERTESGHRKRVRFARSQEQSQSSYRPQYFERPPSPPPPQLQGYKYDSYTQSGPANSATRSSMYVHPSRRESQSLAGRGLGRGRCFSSGGNQNRSYALAGRLDQESSPDVVTGKFGIVPKILSDPFAISTPVGESIISRRVYRGCTVSVVGRQTSADLVELEMLDFDAIMGMNWLEACYATVDCQAKTARFHFLGEPVLEWVGSTATPRGEGAPEARRANADYRDLDVEMGGDKHGLCHAFTSFSS
ncbi:uncharacterized protein [Nicotiana tomentosiformis]|uniref:uncharacterized protein n=1 Tax=Nicotiana tomentosiformis TaxID=4098 RepID=UPI00388CD0E2